MNVLNLKIIRCVVLLVAVVFVVSSTAQPRFTKRMEEKIDDDVFESSVHGNQTAVFRLKYSDMKEKKIQMILEKEKLKLAYRIAQRQLKMVEFQRKTSKQMSKMLAEIKELRASVMSKTLVRDFVEGMNFDDLLDTETNERLADEYETLLRQLKWMELKISIWKKKTTSMQTKINNLISSVINKFSSTEDAPEISQEFKIDEEDPNEAELLLELSLMMEEQLDEMPNTNNTFYKDDVQPETHLPKAVSEGAPRWLHNYEDVDKIQAKYLELITLVENSTSIVFKSFRESSKKILGFSNQMTFKLLAEYYVNTLILQECTLTGDTECEAVMKEILQIWNFTGI